MAVVPRIADVQCSRLVFQPGDRIIVRVNHRLEPEERRKLTRSVQRWAGADVEVLVICLLDMDLEVEHRNAICQSR